MKIKIFVIALFLYVSCFAQKKQVSINVRNLKGWTIYVQDKMVVPEKFFT